MIVKPISLAASSLLVTDVQRGFTSLCPAELPVPGGVPVPATTLQTATLAGIADLFTLVVGKPDDLPG